MRTLNASKFKEQCLAILDHLEPEGVVVTAHEGPVAKVIPSTSKCADLIGCMKDEIKIKGDVLSAGLKWDAES